MIFNANVDILGRLTARNFSFQEDVIDIQVDNTLNPGATPANGDRYLITNSGSLHANFGTINKLIGGTSATLGNGDIVEYISSASEFRIAFDASAYGEGAKTWDRDTNSFYSYNGTAWVTDSASSPFLDDVQDVDITGAAAGDILMKNGAGNWADANVGDGLAFVSTAGSEEISVDASDLVTAGGGIKTSGNDLVVEPNDFAGDGLEDDGSDNLTVKLDGSTLAKSGTGLKVAAGGITSTEIATGAVGSDELADNAVDENAIQTGAVSLNKLAANSVDASKIVNGSVGSDELASDSVITAKILNANVTTAKLANDAVDDTKLDFTSTALRTKTDTWSSGTSKVITHSWTTRKIMVEVYDSNYNTVYLDSVQRNSDSQVTLTASEAPSSTYTVLLRECGDEE